MEPSLKIAPAESVRPDSLRAYFLAWAIETALGFMVFVTIFGQVAYPLYVGVNTGDFDQYSLMLWGFLGFVTIAAFLIRVVDTAKEGYRSLI
jgi:hypothetical protein